MKAPIEVINFDDITAKRNHMERVRTMRGLWEVSYKPRKRTRTLDQNSYYWIAVCEPMASYMREQSAETFTKDDAHLFFKSRFLPKRSFVNKETGEQIEWDATTTDLDTAEFSHYVDECVRFYEDFTGLPLLKREAFLEEAS